MDGNPTCRGIMAAGGVSGFEGEFIHSQCHLFMFGTSCRGSSWLVSVARGVWLSLVSVT